jgi:alkylated DNA repair dioxygenase AlkB
VVSAHGGDVVLVHDAFHAPDQLFEDIVSDTPWRQEEITVFGRKHPMPRQTYWMGDVPYSYSGLTNPPESVSDPVDKVWHQVESLCQTTFNGVLLNLYRDGRDSMGWHADDEKSLGSQPIIASVNLGAERRLRFKRRSKMPGESVPVDLPHGSVLVMRGDTQRNWLHCVPKTAKVVGPRVNLTFRLVDLEP